MSDPRDQLAARLGVVASYKDQVGAHHDLTPASRDAMLVAMGAPTDAEAAASLLDRLRAEDALRPVPPWMVISSERAHEIDALDGIDWLLDFDDGGRRDGYGRTLGDLPMGIHRLSAPGWHAWLLSAPPKLDLPKPGWGITLPLYGLGQDGRVGSYGDLGAAVASLGAAGADFVGVNPIHAGFPTDASAISPYSPSHRGRLSTLHVDPASPPPAPGGPMVDYAVDQPARLAALRQEWTGDGGPGFQDWRVLQGADFERFALHQALADTLGPYWTAWPEAYRNPGSPEVRAFAHDHADAVGFHAWLQWRAEMSLAQVARKADAAGMRFGLYLDLAVGTHPSGAETWADPKLFARGVSLGAPPDAFTANGQSWGLAPMRPDTLAERGFAPLAAILREQLSHARLLRIDHILGFERAFWVPDDPAIPGAYIRMPRDALLAVARIEAARAGATIVGEDLGNIPDGLHDALEASGLLGCRVAQFMQDWDAAVPRFTPAKEYDEHALTSFGTHDLPTWEGWKAGRDLEWRRDLGDMDDDAFEKARARRRDEVAALVTLIGGDSAEYLHRFLADTPSCLVAVQIEDLLGQIEQPNLPGTIFEHPNWRRSLGVAADALGSLDAVRAVAESMQNARR
ncbi:4-alpha-glucanotransferase [Maribius pontilimi]|uniref:4-alpha-glucanotransferase n=1 Tax=Palleronia pontilimi TaxID=1964209 RepID=A0A934MCQ7_9RHOB|nr:4-alpha-glucanotransferase [Palleronia pontilimi]MBJ3763053.1 4-alpha-glucanotransferase [Palleronia pontilimi]